MERVDISEGGGGGGSKHDNSSVDVQALQREVELLQTLLHQERTKSTIGHKKNPTRQVSPSASTLRERDAPSPRADSSLCKIASMESAGERAKSMRRSGGASSGDRGASSRQSATALDAQLVPVDTKRGKWWLKDRCVLSRSTPTVLTIAIKVRETWLWSGRTVIVDKIVTCPVPGVGGGDEAENNEDNGDEDNEDDMHKYDGASSNERSRPESASKEATVVGNIDAELAESATLVSPDTLPVAAAAPSDSPVKQLAHEFLQTPAVAVPTNDTATVSSASASARMELRMAIADTTAAIPDHEARAVPFVEQQQQQQQSS